MICQTYLIIIILITCVIVYRCIIFQDLFLSKTEQYIRLEQDGHVALMASVDYDEGDEVTKNLVFRSGMGVFCLKNQWDDGMISFVGENHWRNLEKPVVNNTVMITILKKHQSKVGFLVWLTVVFGLCIALSLSIWCPYSAVLYCRT